MNVLGITGRDRDAAAALSMDGRVVAAASEESFARVPNIGYTMTGGFPRAAVRSCLEAAGVDASDVQQVIVVEDGEAGRAVEVHGGLRGAAMGTIAAVQADAMQAATASPDADAVLVCSAEPPAMAVFPRSEAGLGPRVDVAGIDRLVRAARDLSETLGLRAPEAVAALDRLSVGAEPVYLTEFGSVLQWDRQSGLRTDNAALGSVVSRVAGEHAVHLSDATSLNARVLDVRRQLAASFTCRLADVIGQAAEDLAGRAATGALAAGGSFFANPRFNTELARVMRQGLAVSAVPETSGRAIGAATGSAAGEAGPGLALGPAFSEEDIKRTLDNCRLDYVYEPDWARLLARASRLLAQGKVVAWFQGAMAFGPRSKGTRSILCDPSSRYARQNMNEYLRQVPIDEPLPVAFAASAVESCLISPAGLARGVMDVEVRQERRAALSGALDWRHRVRVHDVNAAHGLRFGELLEAHNAATGTPGLIEANLAGPGEPVACTPRDAVRTVYSSAIDVLVIGRFMLMKDYWLLRSQDA